MHNNEVRRVGTRDLMIDNVKRKVMSSYPVLLLFYFIVENILHTHTHTHIYIYI